MILRFCSGSSTPASAGEEAFGGVHRGERHVEAIAEQLLDLGDLAFAQQPVVDEDALELGADGLVQEQRADRGVHTTREAAEHAPGADLARIASLCTSTKSCIVPGASAAWRHRTRNERRTSTPRGVCTTSGWNWTAKKRRDGIADRSEGELAVVASTSKPEGIDSTRSPWLIQTLDLLPGGRTTGTCALGRSTSTVGRSILAGVGAGDLAPEHLRHELEAVTDAEDGHAQARTRPHRPAASPGACTEAGPPERITAAGAKSRMAWALRFGGWISQ